MLSRVPHISYLSALAQSRLCRRIVASVILSIMAVEALILIPSYANHERSLLTQLSDVGCTLVAVGLGGVAPTSDARLLQAAERLVGSAGLLGGAIYDGDGRLVGRFGEAPAVDLATARPSADGGVRRGPRFDVLWTRAETGLPVDLVGRLDSSHIHDAMIAFVWRIAGLVLLICAFVSGATLVTLQRFIVRPVLQARARLLAVGESSERGDGMAEDGRSDDELGDLVQTLTRVVQDMTRAHRDESRQREQRFRDFAAAASDWFWETDEALRYCYLSDRFQDVTGVSPENLLGKSCVETSITGIRDESDLRQHVDDLEARRPFRNLDFRKLAPDGRVVYFSISGSPVFDEAGVFKGYRGTGSNVTDRRLAEDLLASRGKVLERLAAGAPLEEVLSLIVLTIEKVRPTMRCSVQLLYDGGRRLRHVVGPSLPEFYNRSVDGIEIGPQAGTCGAAAHKGERVIVEDVGAHPYPADVIAMAERADVRACWSEPVFSSRGKVLGTIAVCYAESRGPLPEELELITESAQLAGIAIERRRALDSLHAAKEEAELASRAKSNFLANMSHELRTPLNAVIGFSDMLRLAALGPVGNPKYVEYAQDINESGKHLLQLINDLLDLSKIEAGKPELFEEMVDFTAVLGSCLTIVKSRAEEGGIRLETRLPAALPRLYADERKLKQILLNLLSNAIKFTPPGGSVSVAAAVGDGFTFSVRDTGIGIAEKDLPSVMEPFSQVDSQLTRKFDGTGLGLPLSKALVELHGGSFSLASEPGVGTAITVTLPRSRLGGRSVEMSQTAG